MDVLLFYISLLLLEKKKKQNSSKENCLFQCGLIVSSLVNIVVLLSCCLALLSAEQLRLTRAAKETSSVHILVYGAP